MRPGRCCIYWFAEPVWVIAYETEIYDADGNEPEENFLCHTFFGNQNVEQLGTPAVDVLESQVRLPQKRSPVRAPAETPAVLVATRGVRMSMVLAGALRAHAVS